MISITILTKNSEKYLAEVLKSLSSFDEVLILDTGSTDRTREIATSFVNVSWKDSSFIGFGPTHNVASSLAKNDWILSLDSDEILTEDLIKEIQATPLKDTCVYSFWRKNYYRGRHIKGCGWYPDRVPRLYNRKITSFTEALVHEAVITNGLKKVSLKGCVLHYPFDSVSSFIKKMNTYSDLFAEQSKKRSSVGKALLHAIWAFVKSYILKKGFLLGSEGFEISWYNMNCAFYKYTKLTEKNLPS